MDVDITAAAVRHHKSEAFLVIEELHPPFDHWTTGTALAAMSPEPITTAESVASPKSVASAEPVAAASAEAIIPAAPESVSVVAKVPPGPARRRGLGCTGVDAVNCNYLKSTWRVLEIADDRCSRGQSWRTVRLQSRGMTKGVPARVERDETVSLCCVKPFDLAFDRRLRKGALGAAIFEICHEFFCAVPGRNRLPAAAGIADQHSR